MIQVKLSGERVWVIEPGDSIAVNGKTFPVEEIEEVLLLGMGFKIRRGTAQTEDGPVEVRGLVLVDLDDEETGHRGTDIPVVWPIPRESVQDVHDALTSAEVAIARSLPSELLDGRSS